MLWTDQRHADCRNCAHPARGAGRGGVFGDFEVRLFGCDMLSL
jgi:hypothetical protein